SKRVVWLDVMAWAGISWLLRRRARRNDRRESRQSKKETALLSSLPSSTFSIARDGPGAGSSLALPGRRLGTAVRRIPERSSACACCSFPCRLSGRLFRSGLLRRLALWLRHATTVEQRRDLFGACRLQRRHLLEMGARPIEPFIRSVNPAINC